MTHLFNEIKDLGYRGSMNLLVRYITQGRVEGDRPPMSPRRLTSLVLTHPDHLTDTQRERHHELTTACPEMTALTGLVGSFAALLRPATVNNDRLTDWISATRREEVGVGEAGVDQGDVDLVSEGLRALLVLVNSRFDDDSSLLRAAGVSIDALRRSFASSRVGSR